MESNKGTTDPDIHQRISPVDSSITWTGTWASPIEIESAINRAHNAFANWARTNHDERISIALEFANFLRSRRGPIAKTITLETGKPLWESDLEVSAAIAKVDNAVEAIRSRRSTTCDAANNSSPISV